MNEEENHKPLGQMRSPQDPTLLRREAASFNLSKWAEHLGHLRLDKIKPLHVSAFMRNRLQGGVSKRTVKLDIIALRNVLKRARDIDQHIRSLPIPLGLNVQLKSATPKRPLFTHEALEKLCAAAFNTKKDSDGAEIPVTKKAPSSLSITSVCSPFLAPVVTKRWRCDGKMLISSGAS